MAYRMCVSIVLLGALACRASEGRDVSDTAKTPEPASGQARTAALTRDSSGGTVALTPPPGDIASVRRDSATATATRNAARTAAAHPAETTSRTGAKRVTAEQRDTGFVRPDSPTRKLPRHPAPTPLPANDTTPARRPVSPASADSTQQQQQAVDKLAVNQSEYNGWKTFAVNCTRCHGEDAVGSTIAPNLMKSLREHVDHEVFVTTVKNGRPDKGMPTWGPLLTDKQVEDLYAYLKARSEGRLAPGRPHMKPEG